MPCTRLGALQTRSHLNYPKTYEEDIANPNVQVRKVELKEPERFVYVTDLWKVGQWNSSAALTPEASALQSHLSETKHIRLFSVSFWELAGFESLNLAAQPVLPPDPKVTQGFIELFLFFFLLLLFLSFSPFLFLLFPSLFLSFLFVSLAVLD